MMRSLLDWIRIVYAEKARKLISEPRILYYELLDIEDRLDDLVK